MLYNNCPKCGWKYSGQGLKHILSCTKCGFTFYINSKPTASAIIVDGDKILLGKRRIEPSKGKWDVIGGFLDFGEHPEVGVRREVKEETGLDVIIDGLLGFFMDTYDQTGDATLNICFVVRAISNQLTPGDDIEEVRWFAPTEIPNDIAFKNGRDMIDAWMNDRVIRSAKS
ncbi:MAG: NUDIX hydrolase [Patescibacteria group bacterium]|jgi:ADP-ribose pyrophosphatase YjhB (NUDIX family)